MSLIRLKFLKNTGLLCIIVLILKNIIISTVCCKETLILSLVMSFDKMTVEI